MTPATASRVKLKSPPGCAGKKRYATEMEAIKACIDTSFKFGHAMRHYPCRGCGGWHITSEIRD